MNTASAMLELASVAWPIAFLLLTALLCRGLAVARFRWDSD